MQDGIVKDSGVEEDDPKVTPFMGCVHDSTVNFDRGDAASGRIGKWRWAACDRRRNIYT
jgi:hypothetical protein